MDTLIAPLEPVVWLKAKYSCPKQRGRYAGGANSAPIKKRKKTPNKEKPTMQHVMHITKDLKTVWFWRAI